MNFSLSFENNTPMITMKWEDFVTLIGNKYTDELLKNKVQTTHSVVSSNPEDVRDMYSQFINSNIDALNKEAETFNLHVLAVIRRKFGLTQAELGLRAKVSASVISKIETRFNGYGVRTTEPITLIAKYFKVPVYFITFNKINKGV